MTGTSRGIGLELVKLFSKNGHEVLALSRIAEVVDGFKLPGVTSIGCDITNEDDLARVKERLSEKGKVDILINNAGAIINKSFAETTVDEFRNVYDTNVFGVVGLIQLLLPLMNKESHVINVSSMGGVQGSMKFAGLAAYSSSKGALITLTELLAEEYKETGPSFNVLALGAVQTEMLEEAFPGYKAPLSALQMAEYIMDFSLTGNKYYNGKILQVSSSTP
ncbi:SDR family oxidoreductase [Antarcticibacterium sp. W02-3]|uniref:SDR family NAD(P)-dependent oxidoreductase n=1 Tax=Antarcticibacterium sp. W02-3 TaxID=2183747 RepID=UPI003340B259